ncbi:hypothetical protein HBN50_07560 [Halobacteriovorax sp. GB3]|uniref:hypothetical protein n=1 Tax=Halobacteriovorax sp. GB3 TaxID=2719615 RepID=UPI00235F71E9|nr:hypothetical protein [Halobacteriovorax sp. GB3]MDD0852947.1 hypothetical protein [Halobacteriovorax sp. GB3]
MKLTTLLFAGMLVLSTSCSHFGGKHCNKDKKQCSSKQCKMKKEKCAKAKKDGKQCSLEKKKDCCKGEKKADSKKS